MMWQLYRSYVPREPPFRYGLVSQMARFCWLQVHPLAELPPFPLLFQWPSRGESAATNWPNP